MANRNYSRVQALEKEVKVIFAKVQVGAAGAVADSKGLASAVKESAAGQYSIALEDSYVKLLHASVTVIASAGSDVATVEILEDDADIDAKIIAGTPIKIQCYDETLTAVNPASGTVISIALHVRNSTVSVGND